MEQSKKGQHHPNAAADKQSTSELSAVPKPKHKHYGHRERMRTRFQKSGLEGFQPHEILELLLFYALPRVDTNPIAHDLIDTFHSLSGVMDADIQDLKHVKGISENAAVFLKLLPELFQQYQLDKLREHAALNTTEKLSAYIAAKLSDAVEEKALLLCLMRICTCSTVKRSLPGQRRVPYWTPTALWNALSGCAAAVLFWRTIIPREKPAFPMRTCSPPSSCGVCWTVCRSSCWITSCWENLAKPSPCGRSWGGVKYKEGFHGSF